MGKLITNPAGGLHHVAQGGFGFRPASGLQPAVRIDLLREKCFLSLPGITLL
jgi:hypothetical protein